MTSHDRPGSSNALPVTKSAGSRHRHRHRFYSRLSAATPNRRLLPPGCASVNDGGCVLVSTPVSLGLLACRGSRRSGRAAGRKRGRRKSGDLRCLGGRGIRSWAGDSSSCSLIRYN